MPKKPKQTPEFWIIDTDTPGMSRGQFSASGPYPSQRHAEAAIKGECTALWKDSCACLQSDKADHPWFRPFHIVQVVRTVTPDIDPQITLLDTPSI